ncbi:hypothetical protein GOODEAATRI_033779, partial [Goodea atripinnis]
DISAITVDGAGVDVCVSVCGVLQGQTEVSKLKFFLHLRSVSIQSVLFFKPRQAARVPLIPVNASASAVSPRYCDMFRQSNCGFKGQQNRLHSCIHLHLVD